LNIFSIECLQQLRQTGDFISHPFFLFLVFALGVWRIANMLAKERGPYGVFERFRFMVGTYYLTADERKIVTYEDFLEVPDTVTLYRIDSTELAKMIACVWCSTPWLSAVIVWAYLLSGQQWIVWLLIPFSVSAVGAIIDTRIVNG